MVMMMMMKIMPIIEVLSVCAPSPVFLILNCYFGSSLMVILQIIR